RAAFVDQLCSLQSQRAQCLMVLGEYSQLRVRYTPKGLPTYQFPFSGLHLSPRYTAHSHADPEALNHQYAPGTFSAVPGGRSHSSKEQAMRKASLSSLCFAVALLCTSQVGAEGEAGVLSLRGQGHFFVGMDVSEPAENGSVQVSNQMYVGFQLPAEKTHP